MRDLIRENKKSNLYFAHMPPAQVDKNTVQEKLVCLPQISWLDRLYNTRVLLGHYADFDSNYDFHLLAQISADVENSISNFDTFGRQLSSILFLCNDGSISDIRKQHSAEYYWIVKLDDAVAFHLVAKFKISYQFSRIIFFKYIFQN